MSLDEIETAITHLSFDDLATLMVWLDEYHAQVWEQQIEEDLDTGRLDALLADLERAYMTMSAKS